MYKYLFVLVADFLFSSCSIIIVGNIFSLLLLEYTYVNPVNIFLVSFRPYCALTVCLRVSVSRVICPVFPMSFESRVGPLFCPSSLADPVLVSFCLLLPSVLVADFADCCRPRVLSKNASICLELFLLLLLPMHDTSSIINNNPQ